MSSIRERVRARFRQSAFLSVGDPVAETLQTPEKAQSNPKAPRPAQPPVTMAELRTNGTKSKADLERIAEQNQLQSPFLNLPGEVRNRIYHYAFGGHEIYAMASGLRRFVCMGRPDTQFAWNLKPIAQIMAIHLPLICRQIHSETGKYFAFKFNTFGATIPEYFAMLLESLTMEQRSRIEVVKVNFVNPRNEELLQRQYVGLILLRNLKKVVLRDFGAMGEWMEEERGIVESFRKVANKSDLVVEIEKVG